MMIQANKQNLTSSAKLLCLLILASAWGINDSGAWAQQTPSTTSNVTTGTSTTHNTGSGTSTIGNYNNVGNGVNGSANGSLLNNNSTSVQTGSNSNTNTLITPTQAFSNGGSSALVLPRNPLALPNAGMGRSNFGLQFGVNNNPGFSNIFGTKGGGNALGWFMQGGVTIPFGKIPDVLANPRNAQFDDTRLQRMEDERQLFGNVLNPSAPSPQTNVQGKVVNLNAYNYATLSSPRLTPQIPGMQDAIKQMEIDKNINTPKVLALADAIVFNKPLGRGNKIGSIQAGEEYRYIAHTHSGWVKIILPNGQEAWTKGQFEYLKNDYTQIDTITLHNSLYESQQAEASPAANTHISMANHKK